MSKYVLCRRSLNDFGEPMRYCAKSIRTAHPLNWCDECLKKLPYWPTTYSMSAFHRGDTCGNP